MTTIKKQTRSEVIQVRVSPKLKYALELAAAKERKSISTFIEWAIKRYLDQADGPSANLVIEEIMEWDISNYEEHGSFALPENIREMIRQVLSRPLMEP